MELLQSINKRFFDFIQLVGACVIGLQAAHALGWLLNIDTETFVITPLVFFL